LNADDRTLRQVRGNAVSMIFQEPMSSLNPVHTVERQISESLMLHRGMRRPAARQRTIELLDEVGIPDPKSRLDDFPHQLSGGQRQRVMIAMALANEPRLLIADEPTTALDVTVQAQILDLLQSLQQKRGMGMLFITHDLAIVRRIADEVHVMTEGLIVEEGPTEKVFTEAHHPYTRKLLAAEPAGQPPVSSSESPVIVSTDGLRVWFPIRRGVLKRTVGHVRAVDDVSLTVRRGQTLGIVGESGSGKTTLGRALLRLVRSEGPIVFQGQRIDGLGAREMRPLRRNLQIVFQDPFGSLSPRMSVGDIVREGLDVHRRDLTSEARQDRVKAALREVGLDADAYLRYPHEFSGGQRQRISIARALVLEPEVLVLDEPTSALDMSVQAQIVDLLRDVQRRRGLTYLFISHDLRVVRALANDIVVMKDGKIVESGPAATIFTAPQHPYTRSLIAAALEARAEPDGAPA
jgi:microcin C transport system ATP-binding protein